MSSNCNGTAESRGVESRCFNVRFRVSKEQFVFDLITPCHPCFRSPDAKTPYSLN